MASERPTVLAVLGKGGAGKTVFSALLARALLDGDRGPVLLVDADPACGLTLALGADPERSMGGVRAELIRQARVPGGDPDTLARGVDWLALEALQEFGRHSLLVMGRTGEKGCFCPVNTLLREAIQKLSAGFRWVILDAEAGIEQVNRQVFRRVDVPVLVTDGSLRGLKTVHLLDDLLREHPKGRRAGVVLNRDDRLAGDLPPGLALLGRVPEDEAVRRADHEGRSLLELPATSPSLEAIQGLLPAFLPAG